MLVRELNDLAVILLCLMCKWSFKISPFLYTSLQRIFIIVMSRAFYQRKPEWVSLRIDVLEMNNNFETIPPSIWLFKHRSLRLILWELLCLLFELNISVDFNCFIFFSEKRTLFFFSLIYWEFLPRNSTNYPRVVRYKIAKMKTSIFLLS